MRNIKLFECVANVSEGRDADVVERCGLAIRNAGATLAHVTSDAAHHRSVFTYFGESNTVLAASVGLACAAVAMIDMRTHRGEHPRIGALDVLPFVPLGAATIADAVALAHAAAERIWEAAAVPAYFYGAATARSEHRDLATVRSGEFEGLGARPASGVAPDVGNIALHPSAGAVAIGARDLLIAFNVVLRSGDLRLARRIARTLRERDGGLRTLRSIGVRLSEDRVQVSCNFTNHLALPIDRVVELIARIAARHGVAVERGELIGLVPRVALAMVAARRLGLSSPAAVLDPTFAAASEGTVRTAQ